MTHTRSAIRRRLAITTTVSVTMTIMLITAHAMPMTASSDNTSPESGAAVVECVSSSTSPLVETVFVAVVYVRIAVDLVGGDAVDLGEVAVLAAAVGVSLSVGGVGAAVAGVGAGGGPN
jgi:hypothetical protein